MLKKTTKTQIIVYLAWNKNIPHVMLLENVFQH